MAKPPIISKLALVVAVFSQNVYSVGTKIKMPIPETAIPCAEWLSKRSLSKDDLTYVEVGDAKLLLVSSGARVTVYDAGTYRERLDVEAAAFEDNFLANTKKHIGGSDKNGSAHTIDLSGVVILLNHPQEGLRAFDSSGFELLLPEELKALSGSEIKEIIKLNGEPAMQEALLVRTQSLDAYVVRTKTIQYADLPEADLWSHRGVLVKSRNQYAFTHNHQLLLQTLLASEEAKFYLGTSDRNSSKFNVSAAEKRNKLARGATVLVNHDGKEYILTASKEGILVYGVSTLEGKTVYWNVDATFDARVDVKLMSVVGGHLILVTETGFMRSVNLENLFSDDQNISFKNPQPLSAEPTTKFSSSKTPVRILPINDLEFRVFFGGDDPSSELFNLDSR